MKATIKLFAPSASCGALAEMLTGDRLFRIVVQSLDDGVLVMDTDHNILFWNRGAERITGLTEQHVVGRRCLDDVIEHTDADGILICGERCPVQQVLENGERTDRDVFVRHLRGHRIPVRVRTTPLMDEVGRVVGAVQMFTDNTQVAGALDLASSLQETAFLDPLTGVGNRRYSEFKLAEEVAQVESRRLPLVVGFVDIDHFKRFNDTYGHECGDRVLKLVAGELRRSLRGSDFVGRWGGEEFIFVLPGCPIEEGGEVAERARVTIMTTETYCEPLTASFGLTLHREGEPWEQTVARADGLMYRSKRDGRNRVTAG